MEQTNNFPAVSVNEPKRRSFWLVIIILAIVIVVGYFWFSGKSGLLTQVAGGGDTYQAVFLDNNQVYFCKLKGLDQTYATLVDIFYLQVAQPLQPSEPATNVNLIKLGSELHGPADEMQINRDHILFVETLGDSSQVVTAIKQYQEQQKNQAPK